MRQLLAGRRDQILTAVVIALALTGLVALAPAISQRLSASQANPTPSPTASATAPPAAVLLPDERDKALQGVMTLANDDTFGTAFMIDGRGDFLTAASLVEGTVGLRLIDNTGGMHQVRLVGIDNQDGLAMVRAAVDGTALALGDSNSVLSNDPVVLLASPKVENLQASAPATVARIGGSEWTIRVDDLPGNVGGPIVGAGAKVLGVLTGTSTAVPIDLGQADLAKWTPMPGTLLPLAPYPPTLYLNGSDTTSTPVSGAAVTSVSPARASASRETVVTLQGRGFVSGSSLAVKFVPLSGSQGGFNGLAPALAGPSSITVKVPAGQTVQDYVIELINGDGSAIASSVAFTVIP